MRKRRPEPSAFRSPILIGALTVLIVIISVYLAYNANSGLPFVPTYNLTVQVPDAADLNPTDQVMIGGTRVGYVASITGTTLPNGRPGALLHLRLNKSVQRLPVDSTDLVRPVSPLGEKYLEITRGHSRQTLAPGATVPVSHTTLPVEIDDFFNMFDPPTRAASKANLNVFGDAFASRGADLNDALHGIQPLVSHLEPVMRNLLDPRTRWARLFPSLEQAASEVAPVAGLQADLFAALDETFTPLSGATSSLQASIAGGPPALQTATRELPAQARFLGDSAELFHRFRPAFASLATASVQLAPAIAAGIPALRRAPALNDRLATTLSAIERFADDARTLPGLELLTETANLLRPTIAFATPAQTRCNYYALFFRNLENSLSESDVVGTMVRVVALALPQLPNSEAGPASAPADGPASTGRLTDDSFLHTDPYPGTYAPGQPAQCQAGNEVYVRGQQDIGPPQKVQRLSPPTEQTQRVLP